MRWSIIVGNPPYNGGFGKQLYPFFYLWARENCDQMSMIFPTSWQEAKSGNGLKEMNTKDIKQDKQIVFIDNLVNVFKGVSGARSTNIVYWKKGYDNGLDGKQLIYSDGENPKEKKLAINKDDVEKPIEILKLVDIVTKNDNFNHINSVYNPYHLRSDFFKDPSKYHMPDVQDEKISKDDLKVYGMINKIWVIKYIPSDYPLKPKTEGLYKYKVYIREQWGGWNNEKYLGGAYGDIILALPYELSTESFLESGCFNDLKTVKSYAKYILSKFTRALLFNNKYGKHIIKGSWDSVPVQDFTEDWWDTDNIDEIDEHLFDKYGVPEDIRQFVRDNIQPKTVNSIIGYKGEGDYERISKEVEPEEPTAEDETSSPDEDLQRKIRALKKVNRKKYKDLEWDYGMVVR